MVGKRLEHYQILEQIGAGGMGQVYRARDEKLDREEPYNLRLTTFGDTLWFAEGWNVHRLSRP